MESVLVIDDDSSLRDFVQLALRAKGFNALTAANCRDGITAAQAYPPDIIVCDVDMPDGTGYDVLSALRRHTSTAAVPFVFITGVDDPDAQRRGMESGAD